MRTTPFIFLVALLGAACGASGCASSDSEASWAPMQAEAGYASDEDGAESKRSFGGGTLAAAPPASPSEGPGGGGRGGQDALGDLDVDDEGEPVRPQGERPADTAVEPGRSSPLLIYSASLHMAVFQVEATQKKVVALAKSLGGFLARQDDRSVVVRVPRRRFEQALNAVEGLGDVVHRQVEAKDVTEEFRDLTIRLRNLEAVRERLESLLAKAKDVKEALEVQRELTRITEDLERLKGRLRFIEDRVAYSTLTVFFQPRPQNDTTGGAPPAFTLPFPWVQELGLRSLMDVR